MLSSHFLKTPLFSKKIRLADSSFLEVSDPKAVRAMLALMNMQAVLGGAASHWGGPSAFLEIFIALTALAFNKSKNWHEYFHIINDAGHCENALYAVKANYEYGGLSLSELKKFRSIEGRLTGHGESHLFPEGVYLSNGPLGSTLAQAQGLSMADRMKKRDRITLALTSDGAIMEGEAKEVLASIPGLAQKNLMNPFILIISDNNTKLSGKIDEDSFSMEPSFKSLSPLGWKTFLLKNPYDLQNTLSMLEKILKEVCQTKPIALQVKTIKGYGLSQAVQSSNGGHGWPLKSVKDLKKALEEIYQGEKLPKEFLRWADEMELNLKKPQKLRSNEKVQKGVSKAMIKKAEEGFPIISISADLQGSTGVEPFRKKFPEKSFDMGVAEANMFSAAAGFSKQGFIPFVDTFSQFGVTKGTLPLFMAALSQAPVIAILSHAGFQDAADGASHQCLSYLAQTGSLPHTYIYTLSSSSEAEALIEQAISNFHKEKKNFIFFLGRETFPSSYLPLNETYTLNKAQIIFSSFSKKTSSKKVCTLASSGTLLNEALQAGKILAQKGWGVYVLHPSIINHPDISTFKNCLAQTKGHLLTIEDHQIKGGMGSFLAHTLALEKIPFHLHSLGASGGFGRSAYKAKELYKLHGLDAQSIVKKTEEFFLFKKN